MPFWQAMFEQLPFRSLQQLVDAEDPSLLTYLINQRPH